MAWKVSFLIDYNSAPTYLDLASAHKGGWSETLWWLGDIPPNVVLGNWARKRAPLLTQTCRIIGARVQTYTLVAGKLIAGGSSTTALGIQGNPSAKCDLPQVALSLIARSNSSPNTRRFTLRGIADQEMQNGEWQPFPPAQNALTALKTYLASTSWGFPGRDLSKPSVRITNIVGGILTLTDAATFVVGDYVRLLKASDVNGKPVIGVYRVSAKSGNDLTLENFPAGIIVKSVGRARVDAIALYTIGSVETGRATVRKIGRPFEAYRGRRSKRRAA